MPELIVVVDLECANAPMPLGKFLSSDEDIVRYQQPNGSVAAAPADCVALCPIQVYCPSAYDSRGWPGAAAHDAG